MPSSGVQTCADRKSTRLNSSHGSISYAVFCLKKSDTLLMLTITAAMDGQPLTALVTTPPPVTTQVSLPTFFFNDTATTEIYTLSLHDALPISRSVAGDLTSAAASQDEGHFLL